MLQTSFRPLVRLVGVLVGVATVSALAVGVPALWTRALADGRILTVGEAPVRNVAVVFGAEMYPSGRPSPYLRARLDLAAALYADGKARVLIVSGADDAAHHHEATMMKAYLVDQGVPAAAVVVDPFGLDTYDTCLRARDVFGVDEVTLVSQRYHLHRAVATCRALGVDAVGVGDVSVKRTSRRWDEFARRELGANLKMVWDLVTARRPADLTPSDAVGAALAR